MEFRDVIEQRKSIRSFSDQPVDEATLTYILECAQKAPSWANKQCWRFIVIRNKEIIQQVAKTSVVNHWVKTAPCLIIACGDPTESGLHNDMQYFLVDVAIAFEHLILAATDVGLGSCWIGGFDEQKIKDLLEIPKRIRVVAFSPIGYPSAKPSLREKAIKVLARTTARKSLAEIVHYEKW
ncbi:MAG: nitroreductase family protein [Candidatus Thermoplasmatota archaeon]